MEFSQFQQWRRVMAQAADALQPAPAVLPAAESGAACVAGRPCASVDWSTFLGGLQGAPALEQAAAVDRWVNQRPYVEDLRNWGQADYWETPAEFLANGGDCEDFAIAKYFSLRRLGFADEDLRIVIARDLVLDAFHAVLAVRIAGEVWLLDNQSPAPLPLAEAGRYRPVYSVNAGGWAVHALPELAAGPLVIIAAGPSAAGR